VAGTNLGQAQPGFLPRLLHGAGPESDPRQTPPSTGRRGGHTLGGAGANAPADAGLHHGASLDEIT
jgi:hypothetical protein